MYNIKEKENNNEKEALNNKQEKIYKLEEKFKKSTFAKKCEQRQKRANLTDFDRFKVMRLRQKRAVLRHVATKAKGKNEKKDKKEKKAKK